MSLRHRLAPNLERTPAMALRFTEEHARSLAAHLLQPGEQILHRIRGVEKPFWTKVFFRIGAFFWRYYLVVGTNHRLLFVRHGGLLSGYSAKDIESVGLTEIQMAKLGWGIFTKNLHVSARQGAV